MKYAKKLSMIVAAAALAFTTACTNDATSPSVSIAGNWSLRTLNGQTLPVFVNGAGTITGETLTLNNDGSYSDVVFYSTGTSSQELGFYTVSNNLITFNDQTDNITYTGSISGDVLTEVSGSFTSVYQKQ